MIYYKLDDFPFKIVQYVSRYSNISRNSVIDVLVPK